VARAETVAACELGIPPVSTNHLKLNLFSEITPKNTLALWAISQAKSTVTNIWFLDSWAKIFIILNYFLK
jgi:hypothetical protein